MNRESHAEADVRTEPQEELGTDNENLQSQLVASEMDILEDILEMLQQYEIALAKRGEDCEPIFDACFSTVSCIQIFHVKAWQLTVCRPAAEAAGTCM